MTESLRDRRRRYVADEIERAALELFVARGFDAVTVEDIAADAGMSARTFFRYFASKDDVVLRYQRRLNLRLLAAFESRPPDEGAVTALRHAYLATSTVPPGEREAVLARTKVVREAPTLQTRAQGEQAAPPPELVALVAARMGVDPATDDRPAVIVVAMGAVASHAFTGWLLAGGRGDPAERIGAQLAMVEVGLQGLDDVRPRGRARTA